MGVRRDMLHDDLAQASGTNDEQTCLAQTEAIEHTHRDRDDEPSQREHDDNCVPTRMARVSANLMAVGK